MTLSELIRLAIKRIREENYKKRMKEIFESIPGGSWR